MKLSSLPIRIYSLLLVGAIFISCKETKDEAETETTAAETNTAVTTNTETTAAPDTPVSNAAPVAAPATSTTTAPGMNPPHGQPGHRCEIPVGAPLNSQPSNTGTAPMMQQPAQQPAAKPQSFMQPSAAQQTATTAPGMNPPHGQPGHRCDVAVGAPLPK